ncbi:MAG TPA: DUF2628 domain-containing protein [Beijerinckiaceae bacterium]|nr:DUF2628 domain-containing protein [Beijerinckiaceae bacterium]
MQSFTVHLADTAASENALEGAEFVSERFSMPALVFGAFWLAFNRLWLALAGVLVVLALLAGIGHALSVPGPVQSAMSLLVHALIGLEAGALRRWTLERNGKPTVAVVAARTLEEAEVRFFSNYRPMQAAPSAAMPSPTMPYPAAGSSVLGIFPAPGGRL